MNGKNRTAREKALKCGVRNVVLPLSGERTPAQEAAPRVPGAVLGVAWAMEWGKGEDSP